MCTCVVGSGWYFVLLQNKIKISKNELSFGWVAQGVQVVDTAGQGLDIWAWSSGETEGANVGGTAYRKSLSYA